MCVYVSTHAQSHLFAVAWTKEPDWLQSMGFSRQENWNGLSFPTPGDVPDPDIEPHAWAGRRSESHRELHKNQLNHCCI